ncbi:hypothetical protein [Roseateles violae]|uniref:General secretion pathway protein L n=1 Tax=Roseateles violae TaxID=3058042 RepID=A0ABT8DVA2_9BURK|nr:hypothetical protein [Pelomonas sp. PFR6]MDN3920968.1 hypothetical protein [Pelomonas sp. PFR6]
MTREGLFRPAGAAARGPWLLARGLLRYRCVNLAGVPPADRAGALQAQLAAWQPFPDSVFLVDLLGDQAQVFALERGALELDERIASELWPESLLHEPASDGLHLVECLEGCEGQAWLNGVLLASRWWAQKPALDEWVAFGRQSRMGVSRRDAEVLPELERLAWFKPLRPVLRADQLGYAALGNERLLMGVTVLSLLAFTTWAARDAWDSRQESIAARQALEAVKQDAAPLLAARDKALAAADQSAVLIKQLTAPFPLEVIDHLAKLLPKGITVKELDLGPQSLRVGLELPTDLSRAKVVNDLESGGWFTQVSEVKDAGVRSWATFEMKLSAARPPGRSSNDSGLKRGAAELPVNPELPKPVAPQQAGKS